MDVVRTGAMKIANSSLRQRTRSDAARRAQLLATFDRSGLSAAAFAREQGLNYTTFCGWRQRRDRAKPSPGFVQVEVATPATPVELVIEVGDHARLRVHSESQLELVARLLQRLNATASC